MSGISRKSAATILTDLYGIRTFTPSTVDTMLGASVLLREHLRSVSIDGEPQRHARNLRDFIAETRPGSHDGYPLHLRERGLLRVSVLNKRVGDGSGTPGIDLDVPDLDSTGPWRSTEDEAEAAVESGAHLYASLRGYVAPQMIRKIVGYVDGGDGTVVYRTTEPDVEALGWIGSGLILPADPTPGPSAWVFQPQG